MATIVETSPADEDDASELRFHGAMIKAPPTRSTKPAASAANLVNESANIFPGRFFTIGAVDRTASTTLADGSPERTAE